MKQVIYDCDNTMGLPFKEIDDGLTLLYLLGRPDIHLMGVTTTFGNGSTDQAFAQTKELLRRVNRTDIPVFKGQPERGNLPNAAADFLARMTAERPGQISVLATGPLTNLFSAKRLNAGFFDHAAEIVCMGGYLSPLRIGWRNLAELNLSADAEAAHAVLNASCPVTLMSAQLCLQAWFGWGDLPKIRSLDPWIQETVRRWLLAFGLYCGVGRFYLWDLVPAVYLSYPELFSGEQAQVTSTEDDLAAGMIHMGDVKGLPHPISLPTKILDPDPFKSTVFASWMAAGPRESR